LYVSMGNARTKSNGHREGKVENIYLLETVKILQSDVWRYKVGNERIMRTQEEKRNINTQLLQSLNMLQRRMDKESYSRKEKEHRPHARREYGKSFPKL
jgi:hypothetical protein